MATKPSNIKSLETGTGKSWEYWLEFLESINAKELPHDEIARKVHAHGANEWWSQGVTVAYEQHIGRRIPGQTCDGDFQVTVSKTILGNMDEALEKWVKKVEGITEFDGVKITREPAISQTEKWRYWRCGLEDKSKISVNIQTKPGGVKSSLAINHDKIQEAGGVEKWRAFWKAFEVK
ncbi:MAG: hypothetical protein GX102_10065 [Porphyromonadaceae bacterium]|nr:hypothetical protein [Porphyromonadaceae bacterium]